MRKALYNRASGGISVEDVFNASKKANEAKGNSDSALTGGSSDGVWTKVVDNFGGWLDTLGKTFVGVTDAKNPDIVQDNTPKVLAIAGVGVAAVVLIIALLIMFKK